MKKKYKRSIDMKKILALLLLCACTMAFGTTHTVYIDVSDNAPFNLQLAPESSATNTIVFKMYYKGNELSVAGKTPTLYLIGARKVKLTGTASGNTATFTTAKYDITSSNGGDKLELSFSSGSVYYYSQSGRLSVADNPATTFGDAELIASLSSDRSIGGNASITGDSYVAGISYAGITSSSVTNGATFTPATSYYLISGIGGADDSTNTVTLGNAVYAGQSLVIVMDSATTNLVKIADSGAAILSSDWVGDAGDVISLVSTVAGSNVWYEVYSSDN